MVRFQSSLGSVSQNSTKRDRAWKNSGMVVGKVIKVHNKRHTADVQIYGSSDNYSSNAHNEGVHACRIVAKSSGFSKKYGKPYGEITPIQVGDLVLVGFTKLGNKNPVILGTLYDTGEDPGAINTKNILTSAYPLEDSNEMNRYVRITGAQDFFTTDEDGNFELASHTKAFVMGINNKLFDEEKFDFEDLSVRDPDGSVVSVGTEYSKPLKFLAVFKKHISNELRDSLRFFVDPIRQVFRIWSTQCMDSSLSAFSFEQDGSIVIQRQHDSSSYKDRDSKLYTRLSIKRNGEFHVDLQTQYGRSQILLSENGIQIDSTENLHIHSGKDITLAGKNINIDGDLKVKGKTKFKGDTLYQGDVDVIGDVRATGHITELVHIELPKEEPEDYKENLDSKKRKEEQAYQEPDYDAFIPNSQLRDASDEMYEVFEDDETDVDNSIED